MPPTFKTPSCFFQPLQLLSFTSCRIIIATDEVVSQWYTEEMLQHVNQRQCYHWSMQNSSHCWLDMFYQRWSCTPLISALFPIVLLSTQSSRKPYVNNLSCSCGLSKQYLMWAFHGLHIWDQIRIRQRALPVSAFKEAWCESCWQIMDWILCQQHPSVYLITDYKHRISHVCLPLWSCTPETFH